MKIRNAAVEKHAAFNKGFNFKIKYALVFKDGTEVKTIPGTCPPEPFTLCRYKEISGFGYSQIKLYLVPLFNKRLHDLRSVVDEPDSDSGSSDEMVPADDQLFQSQPNQLHLILPVCNPPPLPDPLIPSTSLRCLDTHPTNSASIFKVECPLCFEKFPVNEVQHHAAECPGSFGLLEDDAPDVVIVDNKSNTELPPTIELSENISLVKCINDLKESSLKSQMEEVRITVQRKMVWEDYKRARYCYYEPDRVLKVTFTGECAVDDGGPKRKFFSGTSNFVHVSIL